MCLERPHTLLSSAGPMQGWPLEVSSFGYRKETKWSIGCWDEVVQSPGSLLSLENSGSHVIPRLAVGGESWVPREATREENKGINFLWWGGPSEQPPPSQGFLSSSFVQSPVETFSPPMKTQSSGWIGKKGLSASGRELWCLAFYLQTVPNSQGANVGFIFSLWWCKSDAWSIENKFQILNFDIFS